ncbi:hypothetical protein K443DRAFT_395431 [Laccaria amethystina LaAM-08-1]|uniref:Uncharacterized protein n=1 Tax=Laccaria amethystina LaAM-08-1 TaxID=1095629 RepID=A0A0C9WQS3_9AGAR|nr:hypothetical protein K443DRAFT_395431 [Laccaria amethystina LaAM-08-1]
MACAWEMGLWGCLCEIVMRFRCDTPNSGPSDFLHHIPLDRTSPTQALTPLPRRPRQRRSAPSYHIRINLPLISSPSTIFFNLFINHVSSHASP